MCEAWGWLKGGLLLCVGGKHQGLLLLLLLTCLCWRFVSGGKRNLAVIRVWALLREVGADSVWVIELLALCVLWSSCARQSLLMRTDLELLVWVLLCLSLLLCLKPLLMLHTSICCTLFAFRLRPHTNPTTTAITLLITRIN